MTKKLCKISHYAKRNFACLYVVIFLNKTFPKKICYEYYQSAKQFTPKLLRLHILSRSNMFAKIISRRQKLTLVSLNFGKMFISVRWCAEPMTQLCRLAVGGGGGGGGGVKRAEHFCTHLTTKWTQTTHCGLCVRLL